MFDSLLLMLALQSAASPAPAIATLCVPRATLRVEIADTEPARERGLMDRTVLAPHTGMLFVFDADRQVEFWMKDTLVPLDMVFVGADGVVRSVAARVPSTTPATAESKIPRRDGTAKYVIELPAGEAAADGIRPGAIVRGITAIE
ncbi:MAG TPA: DUF192 domain-containing protein [Candidatus Baltobacteraceae bacterium]|jgi:hypothetical protein